MNSDTIFALSSGPPPAAVAIVRISGPKVRFGLETLIGSIPEPRRATLRFLRHGDGNLIDRGLVLFFPGPGSFTGEDMAEFHLHGGRAVVAALLGELERFKGYRAAEAGEFTRRAFDNGRVDLTQVEGLADLILAETEGQRRQALRQADGALGRLYEGWRSRLINARALLEAELDFSDEEDVPGAVSERAWADVRGLREEINRHLADHRGERLRDGVEIVVLGPPNAGKSSLINALARREVAIVAPEPGTTRDLIEVRLDLGGLPATVIDTAGLREASGGVELEGIRRARARAEGADLVLWLTDAAAGSEGEEVLSDVPAIRVGSKVDLIDSQAERSRLRQRFDVVLSAKTGDGVDALLTMLAERVGAEGNAGETPLITRSRYRSALRACVEAIDAALDEDGQALELRAEELRRAGVALGRITGRVDVEDLLDVIFRDFCIGK
jgi:tRNA modification GTPase